MTKIGRTLNHSHWIAVAVIAAVIFFKFDNINGMRSVPLTK